jgi:hypothetical protein
LELSRGGRVAAATALATLPLSVALAGALKLGSRAQPAYAPCSRAACASASPGTASGAASVEWLNGSERVSAVERALSLEEFGRVASALERLGYRPAPERALAVRFEREVRGRLVLLLLVAVPFEGDPGKPAGALVALEPLEGAAAFQLDGKAGILKLVAEEPKGLLAHLALRANPDAQPRIPQPAAPGVQPDLASCPSPKPQCPTCYFAYCQCTQWNSFCLGACCWLTCWPICKNSPDPSTCMGICQYTGMCFIFNPLCYMLCCTAAQWECISCGGCGFPACYDFQDCWDCPACNC